MGATDEILYSWGPGESRLALVSGGKLVQYTLARPDLAQGAIFLGRVVEVSKPLDAVFVDIGQDRPGFLPGAAGRGQGDALLVQVRADAQGGKGPKLTSKPSLTGRYLTYAPSRPGVTAARELRPEEAERLLAALTPLARPEEGVMLRLSAATRSAPELGYDLDCLRADWAEITEAARTAKAPARLWTPDPLLALLAENPKVERVLVDDAGAQAALRGRYGALVEIHRGGPLFELYDVADAIEGALSPVVALRSGGSLTIEPTSALTAIDVDSGPSSPAKANAEAVDEIARQLRLRNLGGQVVVDFVSGGGKGAMFKLLPALKRAVARDPVPTHVIGVTPLGLVELTRERRGPSLPELMQETGTRLSPRAAALAALRLLLAEAAHRPGRALALAVAPEVAAALACLPDAVAETERRLGRPFSVIAETGRPREGALVQEQ